MKLPNQHRWVKAILAGAGLGLAGCGSPSQPMITGHQGGLLPGMSKPASTQSKTAAPQGDTGFYNQVLPDGHILRREVFNGQLMSQAWFSSLGRPEKQVFYQDGSTPVAQMDFGPDGILTKKTTLFPGTSQARRVEEYSDGSHITRFTVYWPNGNLRTISETDLPSPAGLMNRVQQWYDNGRPKSLVQKLIARDGSGQPLGEVLQGRQTEWTVDGLVAADTEYVQGVLKRDYLVEQKKYN